MCMWFAPWKSLAGLYVETKTFLMSKCNLTATSKPWFRFTKFVSFSFCLVTQSSKAGTGDAAMN